MSSHVEQIKERLNIIDVVSSYIKLEKAGRNLKARCPFHNEKTPSFFISPERDTFHCFGCQKGGDAFTFVEEIEGVDFKDALRMLAERAGVTLSERDKTLTSEHARLISAMEHAVFYFEREFSKHPEALLYLGKRGLKEETIKHFRIGFAPDEWRGLLTFLREKGFTDVDIEKAGLVVRNADRVYDRFRGRIMFPIFNASGKPIAFSGRIFEGAKETYPGGVAPAKYVNSHETVLYNKSRVLYGFDKAKFEIRKRDACVVVEGQMDVVMSHQGGVTNAVATSGTALTIEHLSLIFRLTDKLILAFDADSAGFEASGRGIDLALEGGFDVRIAKLPSGLDPADVVKEDPKKWQSAVRDSRHVVDFLTTTLRERNDDTRVFRKNVERAVLPYVARIRSRIEKAHFVESVARALDLPQNSIWEALAYKDSGGVTPSFIKVEEDREKDAVLGRRNLEERFAGLLLLFKEEDNDENSKKGMEEEFLKIVGREAADIRKGIPNERLQAVLFEGEMRHVTRETLIEELKELLYHAKLFTFKEHLRKATNDLKYAESIGDEKLIREKLEECSEVSKELNDIRPSII